MPQHFSNNNYWFFGIWLFCLTAGTIWYAFKKRKKFRRTKKDKMIVDMIDYSEKPTAA